MKNSLIINSGKFIKNAFKKSFENMHRIFYINFKPLIEYTN